MKYALILAASLSMSGCMGNLGVSTPSVDTLCNQGTASLTKIVAGNARLTAANRVAVNQAVADYDPICSQSTRPTLDAAGLAKLNAALAKLQAAAAQVM